MALEIDILRKAFVLAGGGERVVFDRFSLRVEDGAIVALVGPSGCGKSSLLRIVAGLDRKFSGAVKTPPGRARHGVSGAAPAALAQCRRQSAARRAGV